MNEISAEGWSGGGPLGRSRIRVYAKPAKSNPGVLIGLEKREFDGHRNDWIPKGLSILTPEEAINFGKALVALGEAEQYKQAVQT